MKLIDKLKECNKFKLQIQESLQSEVDNIKIYIDEDQQSQEISILFRTDNFGTWMRIPSSKWDEVKNNVDKMLNREV